MRNRFYSLARELTDLTEVQIRILANMEPALQFVADMSRNQVCICAKGKNDGVSVVLLVAKPTYASGELFYQPGETYRSEEMALVGTVLATGQKVVGRKELDLGKMIAMTAYPIEDNAGFPFAVVSFLSPSLQQQQVLTDTAEMALEVPLDSEAYYTLRPQDGLIIFDAFGRIIYINDMADDLVIVLEKELSKGNKAGSRRPVVFPLLETIMETGRVASGEETAGGMTVSAWGLPIMSSGRIIRTVLILSDITDIREKERELLVKESVIKEIHHRVKNSLNAIAGMLRMQARRTKDEEAKDALRRAVARIMGISQIHDTLAHQSGDRVDWVLLLNTIAKLSVKSLASGRITIEKKDSIDSLLMDSEKVIPLAIATNEVIHNAIRHGLHGVSKAQLGISTTLRGELVEVCIQNDGALLSTGVQEGEFGLGLQIVKTLTEVELGGRFTLRNEDGCVTARIICSRQRLGVEG